LKNHLKNASIYAAMGRAKGQIQNDQESGIDIQEITSTKPKDAILLEQVILGLFR